MGQIKIVSVRDQERVGARRIYEVLRSQILARTYGADGLLPSSRALAGELGVSRSTVTVAFEQLSAEGFIEIRQGARPRVARAVVDSKNPSRVVARPPTRAMPLSKFGERLRSDPPRWDAPARDLVANFRYGDISPADFPVLAWRKAIVSAVTKRPERLAYDDPCGSLRLRTALQGYLWRSRSVQAEIDQIVIVNGSQQGLDLCARLLLDRDDRFVMEDPGYLMARHTFAATGAIAVPVSVDGDGLETERLAGIDARLAYVTPSHQYSLGGVLPIARRHQLLTWAKQRNSSVIEDDYDSEYRYDTKPVPPLHALEGGHNVIYLGTISKTLSPTLRVGYLVVPATLRPAFAAAKQIMDRHTPLAEQEALASMLESGAYDRYVRRARRRNAERRQALLDAIARRFGDRVRIEGAAAGLHLVVWFDDIPTSAEEALIRSARTQGLGIYPVSALYDRRRRGRHIRRAAVGLVMGYSALDLRQIDRGCKILEAVVGAFARSTGPAKSS
ncbi:PLP-dependent aminotransferase family protein [Bradyrhizobium yuanmingense]|uniref:MocR-like pyridoxine biosynthesis transcription factor PdxR n=1 Tax=Bradyrhizobium yuanmingense TaxID=108015 RepID=UPI0023B9A358|nr:PLP-dependent aminotransferase family protein [Bradyrhizobium yuanmingense]MDF0492990.1 PLP-dependent aminotransferase family protein [Bradyrhizobium yuanmingense]